MTVLVKVDRMQYGIGQGGFHAQQIRFTNLPAGVTVEPYRFVYDCGSDTGPLKPKQVKPLHWAIEHFAQNDDPESLNKITVHSLYLSHFQKDHIDGAERLAELVNLKEIVIPHLAKDQLVHLLMQQIASGQLVELTTETRDYLELLERAAGDGPLLGNIPTTRVGPGGEPSGDDNLSEANRNQTKLDGLVKGDYALDHGQGTEMTWPQVRSRLLSASSQKTHAKVTTDFWELRVWTYAQSQSLTKAVVAQLKLLTDSKGLPAVPNMVAGKVDLNELAWAIKNRTIVQAAYQSALNAEGVSYTNNHNVVSLCLHSGPITGTTLQWPWLCSPNHYAWVGSKRGVSEGSWLGTGDALLESAAVWSNFQDHFKQSGIDRTLQWRTVLMPHHGSGSGGNFNEKLLVGPVCYSVFSAGALNKYRHPARSVLEAVADDGVASVVVTEYIRPGFFEHLTYSIS